jgi:hypothetical protein
LFIGCVIIQRAGLHTDLAGDLAHGNSGKPVLGKQLKRGGAYFRACDARM